MKSTTRMAPHCAALTELDRASSAMVGPTSYIWSTRSSTASGLFSTFASSMASRWEKFPVIWAFFESTA